MNVSGQNFAKVQLKRPRKNLVAQGIILIAGATLVILLVSRVQAGNIGQQTPLRGHLSIRGSGALEPLVTNAAQAFHRQHPQAIFDIAKGGSLNGLNAVVSHKADIGASDIYADPALYPEPDLTDHIVCAIAFTMIVNPDVHVQSLTRQQIIDIFSTNAMRNWSQVGGNDLSIVPVIHLNTSGTRATFRKYILGGRDENGELLRTDSSLAVLDTVAHTPGAIGYIALSVLNSSVHTIAIDGISATQENIADGKYSFWAYEHMYTLGDTNTLASAFLNSLLTPEGQDLARRMGYIPISKMKIPMTARINSPFASLSPSSTFVTHESEV